MRLIILFMVCISSCTFANAQDTSSQKQTQLEQVAIDLEGLNNTRARVSVEPKIGDPLLYPYPSTLIVSAFYDDFRFSQSYWLKDSDKEDSLIEKKLAVFTPQGVYLKGSATATNLGRDSHFDFSKNYEYQISVSIPENNAKAFFKVSFCIGMDTSQNHHHGISGYLDNNGNLNISTPDANYISKKFKGTSFFIPKKYRSSQYNIAIRHINGRYDVFLNNRYLGKLKHNPILKGSMIHLGNHENESIILVKKIIIIPL